MQKSNAAEGETPALTREKMEALIKEGKSTSQMAQIFGVSRGTINNKKRLWGLIRQTARHAQAEDKGAHVQLEVQDSLDAVQAEQLLKNIAAFVAANGGRYEISLRINKS